MSQDDIKQRASQAEFAHGVSLDELNKLRREAIDSGKPDEYMERIRAKEAEVSENRRLADAWQQMIKEPEQLKIDLPQLISSSLGLNSLEQAGYFGMAGQDKTMENLVDQILRFVRQITANTENGQQGDDTQFGNI